MPRTTREERLKAVNAKYNEPKLSKKQGAALARFEKAAAPSTITPLQRLRLDYLFERELEKRKR